MKPFTYVGTTAVQNAGGSHFSWGFPSKPNSHCCQRINSDVEQRAAPELEIKEPRLWKCWG